MKVNVRTMEVQKWIMEISNPCFIIPSDAKEGDTIHLILYVTDNGIPRLTHCRRIVVEVK